jgi:hypothetical protein
MTTLDRTFTATLAEGPRQGRLDLCRHARLGGVLRHPGPGPHPDRIEGQPFRGSFMALGDGIHKLAVPADTRGRIGKQAGDTVTVHLDERFARTPRRSPR